MKYESDNPINELAKDRLGRGNFVNAIVSAIKSVPDDSPFSIGIYGRWGTGKSSIVNMIESELRGRKEPKHDPESNASIKQVKQDNSSLPKTSLDYIIVRFEPWNYIDTQQLLRQFFERIADEIKSNNRTEAYKAAAKLMKKYGKTVSKATSFIAKSMQDGLLSIIFSLISYFTDNEASASPDDLQNAKDELEDALDKLDAPVIVIIDDLDRLTVEQIRMIIQLIASVAKLPNVIYILTYDFEIVSEALKDVQTRKGSEYLEKVIQLSVPLPEIDKALLAKYFDEKMENIIRNDPPHYYNQDYYSELNMTFLTPRIASLRDAKRFLNAFLLNLSAMKELIQITDIAAITAMQLWNPLLWGWIKENSHTVCGLLSSSLISMDECNEYKDMVVTFLKSQDLTSDEEEYWIEFLRKVFPKFDSYWRLPFVNKWEERGVGRICFPYYFDLASHLSLETTNKTKMRQSS